MKGGDESASLACCHWRIIVQPGEDRHSTRGLLDHWSTNEYPMERPTRHSRDGEIGFEALALTAEGVALNADVHASNQGLVHAAVADLVGQEDHAGAGSIYREVTTAGFTKRLEKLKSTQQLPDGGALSTRDDEPIEARQILGKLDQARARAQLGQSGDVFRHVALDR